MASCSPAFTIEWSSSPTDIPHDSSSLTGRHTLIGTSENGVAVSVTRITSTAGRFCIDLARCLTASMAQYLPLPCPNPRELAGSGRSTRRAWLRTGDCLIHGQISSFRLVEISPFDLLHLATPRPSCTTGPLPPRRARRGLTPWQEARAKEMLTRGMCDTLNINEVAHACGLSPDRFIRSFKLTTGMPPHRWLRIYRVEFAKQRLLDSSLALSEIACSCGFSDQSHFTRVFSARTGLPPGEWRRRHMADHQPGQ